jgi:hypothetical protein
MKNPLRLSVVVAGACLSGAVGCKPAAKPAVDADPAAATTPTGEATKSSSEIVKPANARAVKPVTATRDERAIASLSDAAGAAPRLGIGNLKRKDPDAETAASDATVVEESKASSPLLQASSAAARAANASGVMSSEKAPVRENMSDEDQDEDTDADSN